MKKTDFMAVMTLAGELQKSAKELDSLTNELRAEQRKCSAGIRDDSAYKVEKFVTDISGKTEDTILQLNTVSNKLMDYAEALIRAKKAQEKLGNISIK